MENEINLLEYWRILLKWKRSIFIIVTMVTFSSMLISLVLPKIYKAEATIMPIGQGGGRGGALSTAAAQMGFGGLLGGLATGSAQSTSLLAVLRSRSLAERIINKYELKKVFYQELWDEKKQKWKGGDPPKQPAMEDTVKALFSSVTFADDKKTQLIRVSGIMLDPEQAAQLVNLYLDEFTAYLNENAFTAAKRNRIFIEEQLERNKAELLESGKELADFYGANRISNVVPMVDVKLNRPDGGGQRPLLDVKLDDLKKMTEEVHKKIRTAKIVKNVPQQVYLQYVRLRQEVLGQVNSILTQQYELAKIDELKEDLSFQVIDWAVAPLKRFKPQRAKIVQLFFCVSLLLAVFYAFIRESLEKLQTQRQ